VIEKEAKRLASKQGRQDEPEGRSHTHGKRPGPVDSDHLIIRARGVKLLD